MNCAAKICVRLSKIAANTKTQFFDNTKSQREKLFRDTLT